jgi:peroxiredoxin-like protein
MDLAHNFRVVAWWSSGRTGIAKSDSAPNAIHFTAPVSFGGIDGRWTPEDLLLGAIASCFTTTFRAIADHAKFEYIDLQMEVTGTVVRNDPGYGFSGILIRANLTVASQENQQQGDRLLQIAKARCVVARALAIQQTFEPLVTVRSLACGMNGPCAVPEPATKQVAPE